MKATDIADTLDRDKSSISRLLNQEKPPRDVGRPIELTKEGVFKNFIFLNRAFKNQVDLYQAFIRSGLLGTRVVRGMPT